MRTVLYAVGLAGVLLGLAGCKTNPPLRPVKPPEEFRTPPDEARYTNPPQTPKEAQNLDGNPKPKTDPSLPKSIGQPGSPAARNGYSP
jgi:hypothetical protein